VKIAALATALLLPLSSAPVLADPWKDESGHRYSAAEREHWKRRAELAREERNRREEALREHRKRQQEWTREFRHHNHHHRHHRVHERYHVHEWYVVPAVPREHVVITRNGIGGWIDL